jgi:mannosylglycoprotein endo-beta-mannosidase
MECRQNPSFVSLIYGSLSQLFKASRGLQHGFPLSPFIFLIIMEALSKLMEEARYFGLLRGVMVLEREAISHLLFVDEILCSVRGSLRYLRELNNALDIFCIETRMIFNMGKSCLIINNYLTEKLCVLGNIILAPKKNMEERFKYMGFFLKLDF